MEFMYQMPYKRMMLLRDVRVKQLTDEKKQALDSQKKLEQEQAAAQRRNAILMK